MNSYLISYSSLAAFALTFCAPDGLKRLPPRQLKGLDPQHLLNELRRTELPHNFTDYPDMSVSKDLFVKITLVQFFTLGRSTTYILGIRSLLEIVRSMGQSWEIDDFPVEAETMAFEIYK